MADYNKEEIKRIEEKWRNTWAEKKVYKTEIDLTKPKFYALDMFPYPSGAGLHVGHPLGYIASDIVSRYKRIKGFNVLHPMGFDAFGLPAEQYAIQTGQHPRVTTEKNIDTYKKQLGQIGFSFDWDREVQTSDPKYYRWTQWIFSQLFNSWYDRSTVHGPQATANPEGKTEPIATLIAEFEKNGNAQVRAVCDEDTPAFTAEQWKAFDDAAKENMLQKYRMAYLSETMVNWCAALGTVLSNDEVKDGVSERGGYPVERKKMLQWSMRITAYAERLLKGLDTIDWPEPMKEMQRNWIGKSVGCELDFYLASGLTPNPSPKERGFTSLSFGEGRGEAQHYETSEKSYWHILKEFSKDNRRNPTEFETILWTELRNNKLGHKIRRQHTIGIFIADFVCLDRRLVIEVDGEYHLNNKEYDAARTAFLNDEGFNVIRFTNDDVKNNLSKVVAEIKSTLDAASSIKESSTLSSGEGRGVIRVFTTRIDTIYGVTFMVIAPEHELVDTITTPEQREEITNYKNEVKNRSERERMSEVKRISGAFTGAYVTNPFSNEKIPVWIADYVLAGYGTGAVMAVPSSDVRDYAFAKHFNLPIIDVLEGPTADITKDNFDPKSGTIINSDFLNGLHWKDAVEKALEKVEDLGIGERKVNYRMRDAIFGRQRYWGEPFPIYYDKGLPKLVADKDLPITLPEIDQYKPTETGEPPLARAKDWKYSPSLTPALSEGEGEGGVGGEAYPFELTTMPGWAGSSWYWFRYMDPENDKEFVSKEAESYWKEVDLYIGGSEHATGHLLYSRFWCKALKDLGYVSAEEPFKKLINQGHIQGVSPMIYKQGDWSSMYNTFQFTQNKVRQIGFPSSRHIFISNDLFEIGSSTIKVEKYNTPLAFSSEKIENGIAKTFLDLDKYAKWINLEEAVFISKEGYWYKGDFYNDVHEVTEDRFGFSTKPEVEKMSKSKYNVVNPDDIVSNYGADTLRLYEMFLGPLEMSKPWNTHGIDGVSKFLRRFWHLFHDNNGNFKISTDEPTREEYKTLHKTIHKIEEDIERFSFNTSVSEFMICVNELSSLKCNKRAILEPLVIVLSPFAPHIAEELWEKLGHAETILKATYPKFEQQYLVENSFDYPISINGKVRAKMNFALDMPKEDMEKVITASEIVQKWTEGKSPKKVIIVQGKIVNVVL